MKNKYNKLKKAISSKMDDIKREFDIPDDVDTMDVVKKIYFNKKNKLKQLHAKGNRKVGTDTIIFNMGSAYNCPSSKLGLCKIADKCYAKKAENQYWLGAGHYREQQELYWKQVSPEQFSYELKEIIDGSRNPLNYLRFNESGDFWTQDCVDKVVEIAKIMKESHPDFIIYTYTARIDLDFTEALQQDNLVLNGSGFMLDNNFSIYYDTNTDKQSLECKGDCSICNYCKLKRKRVIKIKIH